MDKMTNFYSQGVVHGGGVSKCAPTPRYTILDSRLPPCNAISESRPPIISTRACKRELCR